MNLSTRFASWCVTGALAGAAAATVTLAGGCVTAQPGEGRALRNGYTYLGEHVVRGGGQEVHEAIAGLHGDGLFTSIMLVIEDAPVEMDRVVITFADGGRQEVPGHISFGPNSTTREIPIDGGQPRRLQRVDFVFNNFPGAGHAKVELWAR